MGNELKEICELLEKGYEVIRACKRTEGSQWVLVIQKKQPEVADNDN